MVSPTPRFLLALLVYCGASAAKAQDSSAAIERSRLFQIAPNSPVNANGTQLADEESAASSDDSFGTQVILQKREPVPTIAVTADGSAFYTDNAALTPDDKIDDVLVVANAAITWRPRLNERLQGQFAAHASIFRYDTTSSLDFENLGFGAALFWSPEHFSNIVFTTRFDFIELLDRHSQEILRDHEITLGAEKTFPIDKQQAFTLGASLMGGIAVPSSAQRQQVGAFAAYRWQVTRAFDVDLSYRFSAYFYDRADRTDCNHVLSANLRLRLASYADLNGFFSFGSNRSDKAEFDYDVVTTGGGLAVTFRF